MRAMRTSWLGDAAAPSCGVTPGTIPPPPESTVEIAPLFKIDVKRWVDAKASGKPLSIAVNYDYKQLFPKITLTETQLLNALFVVDHRSLGTAPFTRAGYTWVGTQWVRTSALTPDQQAASLKARPPVGDISKEPLFQTTHTPKSIEKLTTWAENINARKSHPTLEAVLAAYGYNPAHAPLLAKFLISKQVLLQAMFYRSYQFLPLATMQVQGKAACNGKTRATPDQSEAPMSCRDFAVTYRGLTNPYAKGWPVGIYKPFVDGKAWLWTNVQPPFPEDKDHVWTLSAKYISGSMFRIYLTRAVVHRDLLDNILGALKTAVKWVCDKLTRDDLQVVVNAAGAVPEPNTQGVVQAWRAAAMACDMAFPPAPAPVVCPETLPSTGINIEPTFWDLYQKQLLAGGVGLVALLVLKEFTGRGKVKA